MCALDMHHIIYLDIAILILPTALFFATTNMTGHDKTLKLVVKSRGCRCIFTATTYTTRHDKIL